MKALKIISVIIAATLTALYGAFLFVVPKVVDINKFEPDIQKAVQENSGFKINTEDLKISTGWNLSAGVKARRIDAFYPNNEKFLQLNNVEAKISLLPLLIKQIKLDSLSADNIIFRMKVEKDGKFYIEKFFVNNLNEQETTGEMPFGLKFSDKMPSVNVKKYSLSLIDSPTNKFYSINGNDFKISDFVWDKKIKISGLGEIVFNKKKQMTYNIKVFSKVLPVFENKNKTNVQKQPFNIIDILKALNTIDLNANLKADLKLDGTIDDIKTNGSVDISGITLNVKGKKLPESFIKLNFNGNKISVSSDISTGKSEHLNLNGFFKYGKNNFIDMNVKSDKILLSNLFDIVSSFLPFFGINDINGISANGTLKANFNIKSDFKKINSGGHLNIDNANVFYNLYNIAVKNINADIDFSRNQIDIKKSSALINGAPVSISGAINTNAYANLSLKADKLPIKGLFATFGLLPMLNQNDIKSGIITVNGTLKGKIDKTKPQIDVLIENLNVYNKPSKINVALNKAVSKINLTKENKIDGKISILSLVLKSSDFGMVSLPSVNLNFNDKDFIIEKSALYFNNSKIDFKGKISDYNSSKKNLVNLEVSGLILANDIKNLIPKEYRKDIIAKGKLPMIIRVSGNLTEQNITAQILANQSNFVSLIDINSLSGKTSLINLSAKMANNSLKISDISLNSLNTNRGLSEDFKANIQGAVKIVTIKGVLDNLQTKYPSLNAIILQIPSLVTFSVPSLKNSKIQTSGNISVNGNTKFPEITGQLSFPLLYLPSFKTNAKNLNIALTKNNINVNCTNLFIDDSQLGFSAILDNNFSHGIKIKSVDLNASTINLDSLILAMSSLPQSSVGQGTDLGVILSDGKGKINSFKMGGMNAYNVSSDFVINNNTLKMSDITAYAYNGKIAGNADYNLVFGNLKLDLQGRSLNAEPAIRGFTGMGNLLDGKLDFDAIDLKLIAGTQTQMMQTLRGKANFIVSDGQMGTLGKLENLLYAQNILSSNLFKNSLGGIAKAVSIKKTGDFKYIKGTLTFANGWADIVSLQTSGPAMSMYIKGKYNLLNNTVNLITLGRLSNDVVDVLGPIGELSVNKLLSYIPKVGNITVNILNQMTTSPNNENLSMLPDLTPQQTGSTKEFKVSIDGPVDSATSIKYFKWLSNPQLEQAQQPQVTLPTVDDLKNKTKDVLNQVLQPTPSVNTTETTTSPVQNKPANKIQQGVADFINNLPDLKAQ